MAVDPLIELRDVNKHFGELHVLQDINLTVGRGEVVVVIGPSGSGNRPCAGRSTGWRRSSPAASRSTADPSPRRAQGLAQLRAEVGMVFQSFNLFAHKTVLDNVSLAQLKVRKRKKDEADRRSRELLERVGLAAHADKFPAQLSGGQQQRVAIARALAMDPKALLFDEPTSALDPEMINEVLEVMQQLARDGMTMIVVTHEMGFARSAANRVVFMADGCVVEDRVPEDFFTSPSSDRAKDFLSKILKH